VGSGAVGSDAVGPDAVDSDRSASGGRASAERASAGSAPETHDHEEAQPPVEGSGPVNHRRYRVHISDSQVRPAELSDLFRRSPNRFSPTSFATFDPDPGPDGLTAGDEITVRLPGPWDGPVVVGATEPTGLRFETLQGHMEAGWIEFRTRNEDGLLVFEIESVARSGDAAFDALYHPGKIAKLVQTEMWVRVLESAVDISGGRMQGRPMVETDIHEGARQ